MTASAGHKHVAVRRVLALLLLIGSAPALAQSTPYKLVVIYNNQSIAIADYPNKARCEAAVKYLKDWTARQREQNPPLAFPGGGIIIPAEQDLKGVCIPG